MPRHHSRNALHMRVKRGRTGQIAAVGMAGYYDFTTNGDVNIKGVQISILLLNEHNISFSGGEQQKLSLVRCFIKNPSVMILDEPTSAFDAGSVEAFADLINEYKKSRIVIITHNEALIEKIDGESINLDTI